MVESTKSVSTTTTAKDCLISLCFRKQSQQEKVPQINEKTFVWGKGYAIKSVNAIAPIADIWDSVLPADYTFLRSEYLSLLEECPPNNFEPHYLLFFKEEKIIGVAQLQVVAFSGNKVQSKNGQDSRMVSLMKKVIKLDLLLCGNLLISGCSGYYFCPSVGNEEGVNMLCGFLKNHAKDVVPSVQGVLMKDMPGQLNNKSYTPLIMEPNMEFEIAEEWGNFDGYLAALKSKYRVRAKKAFKKGEGLDLRFLNLQEIEFLKTKMYDLYKQVADSADFNLLYLHENYFLELKRQFGEQFNVGAYFDGGELIGYFTLLENRDHLDAHFLGYNNNYNNSHQLYLNILFQIVKFGVNKGMKKINFSRTATVIKNSLGAQPVLYDNSILHFNPLMNMALPKLLARFEPDNSYQLRQPFKGE